jgi:flagellar hook protein FlgE
MSSFSIPLSGLNANQQSLNVISNNLANLNTVGFKDQTANFQDLFYQSMGTTGSGNPIQIGAGSRIGSISGNFTNGSINNTGVPSDVAITGNGFFIVQNPNGSIQYTRAGNFTVNASGQLVTPAGQTVLGYPAVNGVINQGASLVPLQVGQSSINPPVATQNMQQTTNLDASAAVGDTYSAPLTVYDSLGSPHVLSFNFTNTGPGAWSYQVTLPAADTGGTGNPTVIASGNLTFDSNGNLSSPTGSITGINITGLADGAADMSLTWNLAGPNGSSLLTQVDSPNATTSTQQDGYSSGTLESYTVDSDGIVEGQFSNGQVQPLGQIALANFANTQGLQLNGGDSYSPTLASGAAVVGVANSGVFGTLTGGALESSNVNISTEFTNLIVTERAFQANARMITTFDSVSNDTINLQAAPGN